MKLAGGARPVKTPDVPRCREKGGARFFVRPRRERVRTVPTSGIHHIARYRVNGETHHGRREGEGYVRLTAPSWLGGRETGAIDPTAGVSLLPPVTPT